MTSKRNIFNCLPEDEKGEVFDAIVEGENVRVERICSRGQVTPEGEWYNQEEHEWVMLLQGAARLLFDDAMADGKAGGKSTGKAGAKEVYLKAGDFINIPAHCRHRVSWTEPDQLTVWLAVFYR